MHFQVCSNSLHNLQYSASQRLAWVTPVRLQKLELQQAWYARQFDLVKAQLHEQGLVVDPCSLLGWIFRHQRQVRGDSFAWGMSSDTPWSLQVSSLMNSAGLEDSLLYTVIPPVEASSRGASGHFFVLAVAPFAGSQHAPLLLVAEHALHPPMVRMAIACDEPCYVRKVFDIVGQGAWCNRRHICRVTFVHGVCRRNFSDDEIVEVPTASRISLSVQMVKPTICPSIRSGVSTHPMAQARQVAQMISVEGSVDFARVVRQAHEVLTHQPRGANAEVSEEDITSLMQSPPVAQEERAAAPSGEGGNGSCPSTLESRSFVISTCGSGPPPVGVGSNTQFDWVLTLNEARRHVAAYERDLGRQQILVHLVALRYGCTTSIGAMCPTHLLRPTSPISDFSDFSAWSEGFLFAMTPESSRMFPLVAEIYQNVPSIVVVQALPEDQVPLVIHVQSSGDPLFFVYLANAVESGND